MARRAHAVSAAVIHREIRVIESCIQPRGRVVTGLASGRKPGRDVIGVVRSLVIGLVAAIAGGGQRQVIIVYVTLRARHRCVEAGQRECRQVVIERCLQPRSRVVADLASVREANRGVRGIIGRVVVRHMTCRTRRIREVVVVVHMTLGACDGQVEPSQREARV